MIKIRNLFKSRLNRKAFNRGSTVQLGLESLEARVVPATVGISKWAVADFDGVSMNSTELDDAGWGSYSSVNLDSFSDLFTNSRSWLDLNSDGQVNNNDANIAIDRIMNMVEADYNAYQVSVFEGDFETYEFALSDSVIGDAIVIITSDTDFRPGKSALGVAPWADSGNDSDEVVFVFAGGSVDNTTVTGTGADRADRFLSQIARTISHELGHAFGLEHQESDGGSETDELSHSIMGTPNRDWNRDFVFVDKSFTVDGGGTQNAHAELLKDDVLGRSNRTGMAVHRAGELTIYGNASANDFNISEVSANVWSITIDGVTQTVDLQSTDVNSFNPFDVDINRIKVLAEDGNDYIYTNYYFDANMRVYGGEGNDTIYSGSGDDYISAGNGNDKVYARPGNDTMYGGNGNDTLSGYAGNDYMSGQSGNDYLSGSSGNDTMYGSSGNDTMYGSSGNDYMHGGSNDDYMRGGSGNDTMYGSTGYDRLYGDGDNDRLDGGIDGIADYLNGGGGADQFREELFWNWFYWANRDQPNDFDSSEGDSMF